MGKPSLMQMKVAGVARLLALALLAGGCSDALSPERPHLGPPAFDVVGGQGGGSLYQSGTVLAGKFFPANPHHGDAIVVTFFWFGSSNIITSVTDRLTDANQTPVGNTYHLVEYVTAGGMSMATYVATNVQNFPDPNTGDGQSLAVQAILSEPVTDGGIMLSAYSGVAAAFADALGNHRSASGSDATPTTVGPGPIAVNAGALSYGVTLSNGLVGHSDPAGWSNIADLSDASLVADGAYLVQGDAGTVEPRWTWHFNSPSTWLATLLTLNSASAPPPSSATHLVFSVQPSSTTSGSTISPAVQVAAKDDAGNTDLSFAGSITIALGTNPDGGQLSGTKTVTATNGVATFSTLSIDKAGSGYTLQATANTGLTGATSATFNITTPPSGIVRNQQNGSLQENGTVLIKGFNPTNPHHGDAIVVTFFWIGSTNIIESVTDVLTLPGYPVVGNTYNLVEYVTAGGISMATYVATNVQGFPDPYSDAVNGDSILAVRATLAEPVTDGGLLISSWTGVAAVSTQALGNHQSASGSGSGATTAAAGPISISAGSLAYSVTMSNAPGPATAPAGFSNLATLSDGIIWTDGQHAVQASAGSVDPHWTWQFSEPRPWLATVLALNPSGSEPPPPNQPPVAAFTHSCSGLACSFTSTSSDPDGSIAGYNWTLGDGVTSTAQNPSHTYASGGTYTVTLTVTDDQGATHSTSKNVTLNRPPVADFTFTCSLLGCNFTSTSSDPDGPIASYSWTFGDDATSTLQNPSHTYATGGTYTVTLTVTDDQGATHSTSKSVTVNRPPIADFTFSCSLLACNFTSTSSDPDGPIASYTWIFGDGAASAQQDPSHTYATGGTYTVSLTVTDNQGATSYKTTSVTVNRPPTVDAGSDETALLGLLYTLSSSFTDLDNDGPWSYTIDWGDGSTSSGSRLSQGEFKVGHTYVGLLKTYTVRVTVTDSHGASGSDTKLVKVIL